MPVADDDFGAESERTLLIADLVPVLLLGDQWDGWPGVDHDIGLTRTEAVPVFPPRA